MQGNPLTQYYRQPKIYLQLPSNGSFYPENVVDGDPANLSVFGMTAMDEIMLKTPDALFTGEAVVEVIKSCIPSITDPWEIPQIDIDSVLIALRIATYGEQMPLDFKCEQCETENDVELDLSKTLDYFHTVTFDNKIVVGDLTINVKPLTYRQQTQMAIDTYQLQRQLYQIGKSKTEGDQTDALNEITQRLNEIQMASFRNSIDSISIKKEIVTNQDYITEWLNNADKVYYDKIKTHILNLREKWTVPSQPYNCAECGHENKVRVGFDNSNFFGNP